MSDGYGNGPPLGSNIERMPRVSVDLARRIADEIANAKDYGAGHIQWEIAIRDLCDRVEAMAKERDDRKVQLDCERSVIARLDATRQMLVNELAESKAKEARLTAEREQETRTVRDLIKTLSHSEIAAQAESARLREALVDIFTSHGQANPEVDRICQKAGKALAQPDKADGREG